MAYIGDNNIGILYTRTPENVQNSALVQDFKSTMMHELKFRSIVRLSFGTDILCFRLHRFEEEFKKLTSLFH